MPDRSSSAFCSSSCCMPPARHRLLRTQEKRLRFFSTVGLRRALKDRELDAKERIISEALGKDFPSPGHRGNASRFILLYSQNCILKNMAGDFLARLKAAPVLCDGATGTLLYAKGIFINRCYDELNVSQPDLIRGLHHEYLQAGAEIIETNTFGGNSFRLARHSMENRVREINLAGARLGREAAKSFDVWVAGSVGPLGIRIEPLGKTSYDEARAAFREQIAALVEGGVDLMILETFGYLEELHQAILAAREVSPDTQLVAQVTIDEEGNCLDGASPETFTAKLNDWGADVIGCNCSVGPVAMLEAIERIRRITDKPLSAQPNAGV